MFDLITKYTGGHPLRLDDLELIMNAIATGFDAFGMGIGGGQNTILAGAELALTSNSWEISEGYVYAQNEVFFVPEQKGSIVPGTTAYLEIAEIPAGQPTTYEDGKTHQVHVERLMKLVFADQSNEKRIPYDSFQKNNLGDISQDYYLRKDEVNVYFTAVTADVEDLTTDMVAVTADMEDHAIQLEAINLDINDIQLDLVAITADVEDHANDIIALTADAEYAARNLVPLGTIVMTDEVSFFDANGYGLSNSTWFGWALCWGQAPGIPDLRTRFIYGAGTINSGLGSVGGRNEVVLLEENLPAHNHHAPEGYNLFLRRSKTGETTTTATTDGNGSGTEPSLVNGIEAYTVGQNKPFSTMPRYYTLAYAKKISA
ncbi:hypothetical protein [uncultured Microscilla sp.]|uniref:hypothetical protein n=1 Tax=uncultured Microscilla sp. TaxID=432653 RepID=UPI0026369755|nr:hypothetical protein [uncultured Microscilla sp.]